MTPNMINQHLNDDITYESITIEGGEDKTTIHFHDNHLWLIIEDKDVPFAKYFINDYSTFLEVCRILGLNPRNNSGIESYPMLELAYYRLLGMWC